MKILAASQIREADAYTIANEPIASIDLMERASGVFVLWYVAKFTPEQPVAILLQASESSIDLTYIFLTSKRL